MLDCSLGGSGHTFPRGKMRPLPDRPAVQTPATRLGIFGSRRCRAALCAASRSLASRPDKNIPLGELQEFLGGWEFAPHRPWHGQNRTLYARHGRYGCEHAQASGPGGVSA